MPLKESDLTDAESYKKACRTDLSKIAAGNAKFWVYKDVELGGASGKKQKYPAFLALVDDNGIRKAMTGKKLICKGTCGIRDNRIAFNSLSGTVPYQLLKVSIPLLLGKAVLIPSGQEEAEEAGEAAEAAAAGAAPETKPAPQPAAQTAPAPPPAAPALTAASLTGAWNKLTKDVQAYAAAYPERKAELFREMTAIGALLKANKAAEAKPKMDRMQELLAAPPEAPPAGAAGAQQVAARWSALVKQLQNAVAANPERKPELVRVSSGVADLIRAGKLDQAEKQMAAVEQALKENPRVKEDSAREGGKPAAEGTAKQEGKEEEEAEEEDDEESKAEAAQFQKDVKNRMVAAMAQVRARMPRPGDQPKPQMRFMAYMAGKRSAVIVAKKTGGAMKKVLAEISGASSGKIALGECIFEQNAHTFVLAKPPAGMAKLLAAALLAETAVKYKVRVRAIDGSVVLDDETDVDPEAAAGDGKAAWEKRLAEIDPRYLAALKNQPANASDLRAAMGGAQALAAKDDFAGAVGALNRLETLLDAAKTVGRETDVIPEGIVKQTVEKLSMASTRWREVHFKSVEGLESLMKVLRAEEDPDLHEIAERVERLTKGIPSEIEASLTQLSSAVEGRNAAEAAKWASEVEAGVETCSSYLEQNLSAIERCEDNPFDLPVTIQAPIRATLADIRAALADLQLTAA
jgi:hypothetical protein